MQWLMLEMPKLLADGYCIIQAFQAAVATQLWYIQPDVKLPILELQTVLSLQWGHEGRNKEERVSRTKSMTSGESSKDTTSSSMYLDQGIKE